MDSSLSFSEDTLLPTETIDLGLLGTLFVGEEMIISSKLHQNELIKEVSAVRTEYKKEFQQNNNRTADVIQ